MTTMHSVSVTPFAAIQLGSDTSMHGTVCLHEASHAQGLAVVLDLHFDNYTVLGTTTIITWLYQNVQLIGLIAIEK
jgi:hypothetical protein